MTKVDDLRDVLFAKDVFRAEAVVRAAASAQVRRNVSRLVRIQKCACVDTTTVDCTLVAP